MMRSEGKYHSGGSAAISLTTGLPDQNIRESQAGGKIEGRQQGFLNF